MSFNRLPILINDELCEVPLDEAESVKQTVKQGGNMCAPNKPTQYPEALLLLQFLQTVSTYPNISQLPHLTKVMQ
jgi:hypothetical protein